MFDHVIAWLDAPTPRWVLGLVFVWGAVLYLRIRRGLLVALGVLRDLAEEDQNRKRESQSLAILKEGLPEVPGADGYKDLDLAMRAVFARIELHAIDIKNIHEHLWDSVEPRVADLEERGRSRSEPESN